MKKLTKAEEDVMKLFWELGPSTVSQLIEKLEDPKPPHSTISSIARILEKKGYLKHNTYGRTYEYYALISQKEYKKFFLKNITGSYFNGSFQQLVSFLVKEEAVDTDELRALIEKLDKEAS